MRSESEGGKRGWGKATLDYLAEVCIWFGLFAVSASLLIGLQNALVASFRMRDYHELFYVSRLGVVAAVIVAVPWAALHLLERLLGRARFLVGLGVAAAVYPFARKVAVQLSLGDGVSALHVEIPMLVRATTAILCFGSLGVWAFQASRVWRALHVIAGSIGVAALVWFDAYYLRTYAILSPFVHVGALLVGAATLSHALSPWPRGRWVTAGCGASMVLLLAAIGVANPGFTDAGRRSVLADETSIYALDALLFRADIRAVQFDVTRASKQPCPELPKVAPWPELALPEEKRKNVILISVDALRKDVLGRKIAGKSITPQLDRFAREARVARRAYTSYPATLFALGGAMTGLLPSQILFAPEPPATLFARVQPHVRNVFAVLPRSGWFVQPAFAQYVSHQASRRTRSDAKEQTDETLSILRRMRKTRRQHVLWVHYLEPHAPYQKHEGFDFGEGRDERYLSEVSFLDAELGRLLGALRSEGWYDDSLIVFFADHGQALGERGYYGHHVFLNGFITDIPFIMRTPDGSARPIEGSVSNIDVAPTVLHFLGVETAAQLTGQSLLVHDPAVDRSIVSEAFPIRGISLFQFANERLEGLHSLKARVQQIQEGDRRYLPKVSLVRYPYRLIVRRTTGTHELFDIARDPSERRDIAASEPKVAARMQKELAAWHTEQAQRFFCDLARAKAAKEATPTDEPPDVHPPGPTPKPPAAPKLPKTKGKSRL